VAEIAYLWHNFPAGSGLRRRQSAALPELLEQHQPAECGRGFGSWYFHVSHKTAQCPKEHPKPAKMFLGMRIDNIDRASHFVVDELAVTLTTFNHSYLTIQESKIMDGGLSAMRRHTKGLCQFID
jgi:hypothetical protein